MNGFSKCTIIEAFVWVVSIVLLLLFVPKKKKREAWISFLFMQAPSWIFGLTVVQLGWLQYPIRFFATAVSSSFTFEFLAFPTMSVLYNLHYPANRKLWVRLWYIAVYPSVMTSFEVLLERNTNLVEYTGWEWYWSLLTISFVLQSSYWFFIWFTKGNPRLV